MYAVEKIQSHADWAAGMVSADLTPDLSEARYNKEVEQCNQADLRPPKVGKRSTWKRKCDYPSPFYSLVPARSPQTVEHIFETTRQGVTQKIHCSDPWF